MLRMELAITHQGPAKETLCKLATLAQDRERSAFKYPPTCPFVLAVPAGWRTAARILITLRLPAQLVKRGDA